MPLNLKDMEEENEVVECPNCGNETKGKYIIGVGEICTICEQLMEFD